MTGLDTLAAALDDLVELRRDVAEIKATYRGDRERARMIGVVLAVTRHTDVPCQAGAHSRAICHCRPVGSNWAAAVPVQVPAPPPFIPQQRRPIAEEIGTAGARARRAGKAVPQ